MYFDKNITKINLKKNITIRYVIALSLIAFLSTIAFYSLHKVLEQTQNTAYLVNISGKQRMLSQHLVLDAYRLYEAKFKENDYSKIELFKNYIEKNALEMNLSNKILTTGKDESKFIYELSNEIKKLYFESVNLEQRVISYLEKIQKLTTIEDKEIYLKILKEISNSSEDLLIDLNRVVLQYQKEGEEKIILIKNLEIFIWLFTIFVLILEVLFIFKPMVKNIVELTSSKNSILESLQSEVEERTSHLVDMNKKLIDIAYFDPLTGLRNRFSLEQDIEYLLEQYTKNHASYAILLMDVDYFKSVNDTYGHDFGDFVLEEMGKLFTQSFRSGDKIYRTGGEEFIVLLNRISLDDTIKIAQKTLKLVENHPFSKDDITISKTVSCGIFHSSIHESSKYKDVLKYADIALYEAKNNGRNQIKVYKNKELELQTPISCS